MTVGKPSRSGYRAVSTKWSSGNLQWIDSSGNVIATIDATNRKFTFPSGSAVDTSALNQGKRTLYLPLSAARAIASNDYGAIAVGGAGTVGSGGILGSDGTTAPALKRTNAATDISSTIQWASSVVTEIQWDAFLPPDMDVAQACTLNAYAKCVDAPTLTFKVMAGIGGSNVGGATGALAASAAVASFSMAGATFANNQLPLAISLTPGTHGSNAVVLMAVWMTYTALVN